jgi:hypothetical protein
LGFGKKHVEKYAAKTGRKLFLHLRKIKRPRKEESTQDSGIPEKVSKMAIGVEGGFKSDIQKNEFDEVSEIVIIPTFQKFSVGKCIFDALAHVSKFCIFYPIFQMIKMFPWPSR